MRLDPFSLPVLFEAHDYRADDRVRHIELHRERVILRRAVDGMRMAINVRVSHFLGIGLHDLDAHAAPLMRHQAIHSNRERN